MGWEEPDEQANKKLETLVRTMRRLGESDYEEARGLSIVGDDILFDGIVSFPGNTNAVVIDATIDTTREGHDLPNGRVYTSGRHQLYRFLKATLQQEELPKTVPFTFTLHLPYDYNTGVWNRTGFDGHYNNETVSFGKPVMKGEMPFLHIEGGLFASRKVGMDLYWDEVKVLQFAQRGDTDFTPRLTSHHDKPGKPALTAEANPLQHYLEFRYFQPQQGSPLALLVPRVETHLIPRLLPNRLHQVAFFGQETAKGTRLLEIPVDAFKKTEIENELWNEAVSRISKGDSDQIDIYEGTAAVRQLHAYQRNRL